MKKVFILLGEPTIDMPVKGKDAAGNSATITAVFKRYNAERTEELLAKVIPLANAIEVSGNLEAAIAILKQEIVAVKGVTLFDMETLKPVVMIEDTRTLKVPSVLQEAYEYAPWELGPDTCLAFLLDLYLATPAWGAAFIKAFFAVHNNDVSYIESLAGN